ncbi:hypothetical protein V7968_05780 [Nocardia vulneris]|uniref:hypothetical protein n=1 Tax=Nocardia vulneris TaxID=1141657 RepID=UPI0030CFAF0E
MRYDSDVTYSFGKREGRAALSFDAAVPGTYQVAIQGDPGTSATAAIGRGFGTSFVGTLLGGIALGVVGLLLGLAVIIVVAVKRSGSKRRAASGLTGGYPSGPPLPGPYQYGGPHSATTSSTRVCEPASSSSAVRIAFLTGST